MQLDLDYHDGLYYCLTNVFTVDCSPVRHPGTHRIVSQPLPSTTRHPSRFSPTSKSKQVESEVWLLCLGSPGVHQLDVLPGNVTGLPLVFEYHPFRFIDFKEQAWIWKQAAQRSAVRTPDRRSQALFLYGFWMYASIYLRLLPPTKRKRLRSQIIRWVHIIPLDRG